MKKDLFNKAWCPLFGKLPNVPSDLNDLTYTCIEIIKSARQLWGVHDALLKDIKSSWPTPSTINFYPTSYLVSARILYGVQPELCAEAERKLFDPDNALLNEDIYKDYYNINFEPSDEDINLQNLLTSTQNKFYEFQSKHLIDDTLELEQAYAIQAINLAWIALYNHVAEKHYLYFEGLHKMASNAQYLLSLAKDWATESAYEIGKIVINKGREGGLAKGKSDKIKDKHIKWQILADQMWEKNSNRSARSIALFIAKKTGGNFNTIRKIIKK